MYRSSPILIAVCLSVSPAAAGTFTYTLEKAENPTADQLDAYARIRKAMDSAVGFYNEYTSIRHHVTVQYEPGVPTADGGGSGNIRFGSGRAYMVALTGMHEIAHTLGVGTTAQYAAYVSNGFFNGPLATAALRQIAHNDTARLHADRMHIWPYGLNYASEVTSAADLVNHCRIIEALYKDLFHESTYLEGRIRNVSTKQCISLAGSSLAMGSCSDTASLVVLVAMGDTNPVYRLELGNRVLDAPDHSIQAGLAMGAWTWNQGTNQELKLEESPQSGGRANRLKMVHSGLYLHSAGTALVQDPATTGSGFDWELLKGAAPIYESTYLEGRIRNVSTRQCISLSDSTLLAMGSCADTASFVRIVAVGETNPVYRLELGFRVLDAPNQSAQAGLAMGTWIWNGGTNQEFRLDASSQSGGPLSRIKMVHSGLYLHPAGSAISQDAATGTDFDWELIKGAVSAPTGLASHPSEALPRRDRPQTDALGRRFSGSRNRFPSAAGAPIRSGGKPKP